MMEETQVVDFDDRFYWSLSQLTKAFGPARETIAKRLYIAGVMARKQRAGHDVYQIAEAAAAIIAGESASIFAVKDPDLLPPKDRLDWYRSQNERAKFLRESGELISITDATQEMASVVKTCVRLIETLPDILEMKCRLPADVIQLVEVECDNVRAQLAHELSE